jgi:5'-3' exoribonuclease 1
MGALPARNLCSIFESIHSVLTMLGIAFAGVPRFFRWLTERYPLTMEKLDDAATVDIDNLYLDMNGIIHNCTHANEERVSASEDEMIRKCFLYIERLVRIARPQKVLFMAIDGAIR